MKTITFQTIAALNIAPRECYQWVEFAIKNKKGSILPPKISMKPRDGVFCNIMPCITNRIGNTKNMGGLKIATRYPQRVPSLESQILLMDADSGEFLALMDGTWITAMRTGAVAAHSVVLFAKKDFSTIGMMGLGNVSRSALLTLANLLPERHFHIKLLKYKGQEEDFARRFHQFENLSFTFVDTPEKMTRGSDVVISGATYLPEDVCPNDCFEKGVLVLPIHTRGFANCDLFFDKIFADDLGHVHHFKYFEKFKSFAEVCDVVNGEKPGRESNDERILVYNIGISLHDICFASRIYEMLDEKGILSTLPDIDMAGPEEKFWI